MKVEQFFSMSKPDADGDNWRRVLSNFFPCKVKVEGATYASIEHAFQGQKALASAPLDASLSASERDDRTRAFAAQFESHGVLGKEKASVAKRSGSKKAYASAGMKLDAALWNTKRDAVMRAAVLERAATDKAYADILRRFHDGDVYLLHFERGGKRAYWGCSIAAATGAVQGENKLGKIMMAVAREMRSARVPVERSAYAQKEGKHA